jgi:hypothetical protein
MAPAPKVREQPMVQKWFQNFISPPNFNTYLMGYSASSSPFVPLFSSVSHSLLFLLYRLDPLIILFNTAAALFSSLGLVLYFSFKSLGFAKSNSEDLWVHFTALDR